MILRRLAEALRAQKWFTVIIELVIVVVGIFLGIQVSNWNEDRLRQQQSREVTERLRQDIVTEAENYSSIHLYQREATRAAEAALESYRLPGASDPERFLVNAYRATQFNWYERHRGTFDALVASGDLGLVSDHDLIETATQLFNTNWIEGVSDDEQASPYRQLFRSSVPVDLQRRLGERCGDKNIPGTNRVTIGYDCRLDWPEEELRKVHDELLSRQDLRDALRLRLINLDTYLANYYYNFDFFGLDAYRPPAPVEGQANGAP